MQAKKVITAWPKDINIVREDPKVKASTKNLKATMILKLKELNQWDLL